MRTMGKGNLLDASVSEELRSILKVVRRYVRQLMSTITLFILRSGEKEDEDVKINDRISNRPLTVQRIDHFQAWSLSMVILAILASPNLPLSPEVFPHPSFPPVFKCRKRPCSLGIIPPAAHPSLHIN